MEKKEEDPEQGGRASRKQGTCIRNVATKKFLKRRLSNTFKSNMQDQRHRHSESDPDDKDT